ncbi:MAG: hypothetical protein RL268_1171 [Pseudomonadota bacterium]
MSDTTHEFTWLVRLGYAARGLVYLILGYLALAAASHVKKGGTAAFEVLQGAPLGTLVLWVVAAGLLAYALFKTISAVADIENHGKDWKGTGKRIGSAASAICPYDLGLCCVSIREGIGAERLNRIRRRSRNCRKHP